MDLSKNKGSKYSTIPLAIRFTAGEESLEDVTADVKDNTNSSSLSSSPQNITADDSSRRIVGDFLQSSSSFFNRKRSGSVEVSLLTASSNSLTTPSVILTTTSNSNSSGSESSGKTWKLIKGKVSQAMEDIKLNKQQSQHEAKGLTTIADEGNNPDLTSDDLSESSIKNDLQNELETDVEDTDNETISPPSTVRSTPTKSIFEKSMGKLRQRRVKSSPTTELKNSRDIEIESGVEVVEEMLLSNDKESQDSIPSLVQQSSDITNDNMNILQETSNTSAIDGTNLEKLHYRNDLYKLQLQSTANLLQKSTINENFWKDNKFEIAIVIIIVVIIWFLVHVEIVQPFYQGFFTCILVILSGRILYNLLANRVMKHINVLKASAVSNNNGESGGIQRGKFQIPDYSTFPVLEIPAVEEFKPHKVYTGWMNEINNYDPSTYHQSMTRSVYIKLDGQQLRISSTNCRIPKRLMWNELSEDSVTGNNSTSSINKQFTRHRFYDLKGATIEMCPKGLARKRYFSRKYPMQLIIKNANDNYKPPVYDQGNEERSYSDLSADTATNNFDIGSTIMSVDSSVLQKMQSNEANVVKEPKMSPSREGLSKLKSVINDEIRITLFARGDREKEDWYRRFLAASEQDIYDKELKFSDILMPENDSDQQSVADDNENKEDISNSSPKKENIIISKCAGRCPADYIKFMSKYQMPLISSSSSLPSPQIHVENTKKNRRERRQEDELWKGIDIDLYSSTSNSVIWANVLIGRILFSCLNDKILLDKIQDFLQRKISAIRLPSFMEDVQIAQIHLGETPPLLHRVSQPVLNERGMWIDADITYEGLVHMTITTKLNLLRLKKQQQNQSNVNSSTLSESPPTSYDSSTAGIPQSASVSQLTGGSSSLVIGGTDAIYDSNAESTGGSSSESETQLTSSAEIPNDISMNISGTNSVGNSSATPGSSRRILRIVDRITASNLFQSATEISYIQRAMENMSTKIRLKVELKGLIGRCTINIPPPPSDRLWLAFRGPPRLWLTAKPALGDHNVDWSLFTNIIENKLCDEVAKYLVYPNMVDIIIPLLGESTYRKTE